MTAKERKFYLCYLNKLLDQYKNTFNHSFGKKPINCLKKLGRILKLLSLTLIIESELLSINIFLVKATLKVGNKKYLFIGSVLKANPWANKIKDLNGEKIIISFYQKEMLLSES